MSLDIREILYQLLVMGPGYLLAICAHEWGHAYMAHRNGDDTAKNLGRMTLNPAVHYDVFGTILFPIICLVISQGFIFGYAKPVPVNPNRFKDYRNGLFWVSFAGPLVNLLLAAISAFAVITFLSLVPVSNEWFEIGRKMLMYSLIINCALFFFNLLPIVPLDGSAMLRSFLSYEAERSYMNFSRYSFFIFIFLIMSGATNFLIGKPTMWTSNFLLNFFNQMIGHL